MGLAVLASSWGLGSWRRWAESLDHHVAALPHPREEGIEGKQAGQEELWPVCSSKKDLVGYPGVNVT